MYFDIDKNLKCAIFLIVNCVEDVNDMDGAVIDTIDRANLSDYARVEALNYYVYCCEKLGKDYLQD